MALTVPKKVLTIKKTVSLVWAGAVEMCELSDVDIGCNKAGGEKRSGSGRSHLLLDPL